MNAAHVPVAVERYVRHAAHVELENLDSGERRPIGEKWDVPDLNQAFHLEDPSLRGGNLALDSTWEGPGTTISSGLVICNSGFLVTQRELSLLPNTVIGYRGEIDVEPGELTILINREGFQHDDRWQALGQRLLVAYNSLLRTKVALWETIVETGKDVGEQAIDRNLLILSKSQVRNAVEPALLARVDELLPRCVRVILTGIDEQRPISDVVEQGQAKGVVYYTREGEGARQFQQAVQQGTGSVHVTEVVQTETLRGIHLRAKGAVVVRCRPRSYPIEIAGSVSQVNIHEADLLQNECARRRVRCVSVDAASAEEVQLDAVDQSLLVNDLLDLSEPLKLVFVESSGDPVIRDYAGRLLNYRNTDVREILETLPDAVGNPVRRLLLQIYMDISNYRIESARKQVKQLLISPDLSEQAQLSTGELLRDYLRRKLKPLIDDHQ